MIAAAFPGQGVQHIGMAGELNATRCEYFDRASEILGYNLLELCQKRPNRTAFQHSVRSSCDNGHLYQPLGNPQQNGNTASAARTQPW